MGRERRARTRYRIDAAPEVADHLRQLGRAERRFILDVLPGQLGHQPAVATRNRKRLTANPVAPWELRVGDYRIYFDVQERPERVVRIVAIGIKVRERVMIGGVEVKLR